MRKFMCLAAILCLVAFAWADQTESKPNDNIGGADGPISFNEVLTGGLPGSYGSEGTSPPQDYWQFSATAGKTYTFTGVQQNCSIIVGGLDLALTVVNGSDVTQKQQDAGGECDSETLVWTPTSSGTFYLVVWEATGTPSGIDYYKVTCEESTSVEDWDLY